MKDAAPKAIYLKDYQSPKYLIHHTDLHVDIFDEETIVTSCLDMELNQEFSGSKPDLILDGKDLELVSVSVDDKILSASGYEATPSSLKLSNLPQQFKLQVITKIKPQENTSLEGLYRSRNMYCTQCEAEGFRAITYYLDRPDVMSEFVTTVVADKKRFPVLLSNGNPVDGGDAENGRHWRKWHDPFKKPCYLFALVAGDLVSVDDNFVTSSGRKVELKLFVEEKDTQKCAYALEALKNSMAWDENVYGREYDLDLFMIVAVDDFNMGAMENKGLNIFNTSCVLADPNVTTDKGFQRVEAVVAHEYFHNWSGNRVTCRDWFQLSLKEGFTVFRDSQFSADMGSDTVNRVDNVTLLRTLQFAEDSGPLAHPVQPSSFIEISNFYTLTIYEKGAEIVRMIYNLLGKELFRKGSDLYFDRHDGQAVTIDEFVQAMADVSGRDFTQFKRWYTQAGTPILKVSDKYDANTKTYTLTISQSCPPTPESKTKLPYHIPIAMGLVSEDGEIFLGNGNTHQVLELTEAEQSFEFENISCKPAPSLLRGFSAPVRLHYDYTPQQLITLIKRDSDGFCRWDGIQSLSIQVLHQLMGAYPKLEMSTSVEQFIDVFKDLLVNVGDDNAMTALMLQLPTEAYISEIATTIDVDAIHYSRAFLRQAIADSCQAEFEKIYTKYNVQEEYKPSGDQIANRSIKNIALQYLSLCEKGNFVDLCVKQFDSANNMTDRMAALIALLNSPLNESKKQVESCLEKFYQRFEDEPLAVDQWLVAQATATPLDTLTRVKELCEHPCFSMTNPNKVRSLIGAYCHNNLVNFHSLDGKGYEFLCEKVIELDKLNPQITSRLITPLTRWRKYDETRQKLMTDCLNKIAAQDLSKDVYEVVSKALG